MDSAGRPVRDHHRRRSGRGVVTQAAYGQEETSSAAQTIKVKGKLNPAAGGEQVVVSARAFKHGWVHKVVQVAANGTFTTVWKVSRFTIFVAQWRGDADQPGCGLEGAAGLH